MTTTRKRSDNWEPEDRLGYVIDGRELEGFAVNLRVRRAHRIAFILREIADLLDDFAGQKIDDAHIGLIRQISRKEDHKQFQKLMARIVDALRQGGEKGRRAARLTITRYLEILLDEPQSSAGSFVVRQSEKPPRKTK